MLPINTSSWSIEKWHLTKLWLILISLVLFSIKIIAQNGWTRKSDMPTARAMPCAVSLNKKIYVLGGGDAALNDYNDNQVYDPSTDSWETKQPMENPRAFLSAAVVNDTIYAIGGSFKNPSSIVEAYDPLTNIWTQKANMLSPRYAAAACVVNGIIYNVGGNHTEHNCEAYNPITDTWLRKADIPENYGGVMVAPYGGMLYVIGGGFQEVFKTVYAYDPHTDIWTKKASMPTARGWAHPAPVVDGKVYIIGGFKTVRGKTLPDVEVYDPILDSWTKLPDAPFKLAMFGAAVVNGKIYIIGGTTDWSTIADAVWEYDPAYLTGMKNPIELQKRFFLEQNYPNPFNPSTTIKYHISERSFVTLILFDVLGNEIEIIVNEEKSIGNYEVKFDASDLPSGIYLYRLQTGDFVETKKMVLLK